MCLDTNDTDLLVISMNQNKLCIRCVYAKYELKSISVVNCYYKITFNVAICLKTYSCAMC